MNKFRLNNNYIRLLELYKNGVVKSVLIAFWSRMQQKAREEHYIDVPILATYGWAAGDYWHPHCAHCRDEFTGDKRAYTCKPCAIDRATKVMKYEINKPIIKSVISDNTAA